MAAPRLFGEQRVPISSWAKAQEQERAYVPGRNRYDDDDFQPAHVDSFDGSSYCALVQGGHYAVDSGRGLAAPRGAQVEPEPAPTRPSPHTAEQVPLTAQTPLTLDALKYLDEASTAPDAPSVSAAQQDLCIGVPAADVLPADALSAASDGSASARSCADWKAHKATLYKHRSGFDSSVAAWRGRVQSDAQWESAYVCGAEWMHDDTVLDPATGAAMRAPAAPPVLVDDAASESASMKLCRATQTASSVCAMKNLQAQQLAGKSTRPPQPEPVRQVDQDQEDQARSERPETPVRPDSPVGSVPQVRRFVHIDRVDLQAAEAAEAAEAAQAIQTSTAPASAASAVSAAPSSTHTHQSGAPLSESPVLDKGHVSVVHKETAGTEDTETPETVETATRTRARLWAGAGARTPGARGKHTVQLCDAHEGDIDAMVKIYNEEATKGTQAWGSARVTAADFEHLMASCRAAGLPLLVALVARDDKSEAVGFGYLSRARPTWKNAIAPVAEPKTVQAHVYVRMRYRGRGIGSMLMSALMDTVAPVARVLSGVPGAAAATDSIVFVTVELQCGSENGMMEREYERVLTQSFGFHAQADACDTMHWNKKTGRWLKTLTYYYVCQKASTEGEGEAASASSVKVLDGGY